MNIFIRRLSHGKLSKYCLVATLFLTLTNLNIAQDDDVPAYVGPQSCPSNPSILGYTNSSILHTDMLNDARDDSYTGFIKDNYTYVICPDTVMDFGSNFGENDTQTVTPIIPLMTSTYVTCGEDGKLEDNCVLTGGTRQIHFLDFLVTEDVWFVGITMTKNEGVNIGADGNPLSSAVFANCLVKHNIGHSNLQIYFDGDINNRKLTENYHRNNPEIHRMSKDRDTNRFELPFDESVYKNLISARSNDENETKRRLFRNSRHPDIVSAIQGDPSGERKLQGHPGMYVVLFGTDMIDNIQNLAVVVNFGGILEIIDSDISSNEVGFSTITVVYGGNLYMHSNTRINNNFDDNGPIFVDKYSILAFNDEVSGENNNGGICAFEGIFLEDDESSCAEEGELCSGECCPFGDTTCDFMTEEPTPSPTSSSNPAVETKTSAGDEENSPLEEEDRTSYGAFGRSQEGSSSGGGGCGPMCISLAVVFPVAVLALLAVAWKKFRGGIDSHSADTGFEVEPQAMAGAVDA